MRKKSMVAIACVLVAGVCAAETISLEGEWRFELDRGDTGVWQRWFTRDLNERIQLPGALQHQGFGDDITVQTQWTGGSGVEQWMQPKYEEYRQPGNIMIPFFLQPEKHYVGTAWYQREIEIPDEWTGRRVVLSLERAHWETQVWVNETLIGSNDSLSVPHVYDLGTELDPGVHRLSIRVDNRLIVNVGARAHSVSDETQGNWNGLIGELTLTSTSPVWIDDAQVFPDLATKSARVEVAIGNSTGMPGEGVVRIGEIEKPVRWSETGGEVKIDMAFGEVDLWDEFNPALQRLDITLSGDQADDRMEVVFGMREITTRDGQFLLNGRPIFLRGTLECCIFPLTGYPSMDVDAWKRIIRICQEHGLNHIRFHSWCPPKAAFIAADEMGFYLQVEPGAWTTLGAGWPVDQWLYEEAERMVKEYGNHPSFLLMAAANEPHGTEARDRWLGEWVTHWKKAAPRQLHAGGSGWPVIPENEFQVIVGVRGPKGWHGRDYRDDIRRVREPVIVHEMGQWCAYPDFDQIPKFTGPLQPNNLRIFRTSLERSGMLHQAKDFLMASGRLQVLCYKEEIEAALRTPGMAGIHLLALHDFPGQGTALVGMLDAFWDSKPYSTPEVFRRFYNTTVPLVRLQRRTWSSDETLEAEVEIAHFGAAPLEAARPYWKLVDRDGRVVAGDEWSDRTIPLGQGISLGRIRLPLQQLDAPRAYRLVVGLEDTPFENDWDVWIYSSDVSGETGDVLVSRSLDEAARRRLAAGGRVLLLLEETGPENQKLTFEPVFWNRFMWQRRPEQTLGMWIDSAHPALAQFPTDDFQNWQWHEIVTEGYGIVLDELPSELQPIVQPIDDWNSNRKLGLVFEMQVGPGKLLVCAADLTNDLASRPAARQLRASLVSYAGSDAFDPNIAVDENELVSVLAGRSQDTWGELDARVIEVSSEDSRFPASNVLDGNPDTIWHTRWQPQPDPMPHHLVIDLGRDVQLRGLRYLPRQNMARGRWAECQVFAKSDTIGWDAPVASVRLENNAQWQTIDFGMNIRARYLKVSIHSEVGNRPIASAAGIELILAE